MSAKYAPQPTRLMAGLPVVSLTISQDNQIVHSTSPVPDPEWVYHDPNNHWHFWGDGNTLPTLELHASNTYWCGTCRDEHIDYEYRCARCGETIEPGTKPPNPFGEVIPGVVEISLELRGEGPDEFVGVVEGKPTRFTRIALERSSDQPPKSVYVGVPE